MSAVPEGIKLADVIVLAPLSAEQHSRLLENASKCISVVTLSSGIGVIQHSESLGLGF
jgi:hypothetical protein